MKRAAVFEAVMSLLLIFLLAVLFVSVTAGPSGSSGNWSTSSVNATEFMYAGNDDTLYIFNYQPGTTYIDALSPDGKVQWTFTVDQPWVAVNFWERRPVVRQSDTGPWLDYENDQCPVFAGNGDLMFLYLRKYSVFADDQPDEKVIAIRQGKVIWERPLYGDDYKLDPVKDVWLKVSGDRLYAYRSYNLSVFGMDGTLLFSIGNVSDPPAVDPEGNIYVTEVMEGPEARILYDLSIGPRLMKVPVPSDAIVSYYPNGTLRWRSVISGDPARQAVDRKAVPDGCELPLYNNGRLYVPLEHGMIALDTGGKTLWKVSVDDNVSLLSTMPFGPDGIVYMVSGDSSGYGDQREQVFYTIKPDGNLSVSRADGLDMDLMVAAQGMGYYGYRSGSESNAADVGGLMKVSITAMDLRSGDIQWARDITPAEAKTVVADGQNVFQLFESSSAAYNSIYYTADHPDLLKRNDLIYLVEKNSRINVLTGGSIVYVSYYLINYEYPVGYGSGNSYTWLNNGYYTSNNCPALLNRSKICYAIGVTALDANGTVLWNRALDSMLTSMAAGTSTLYYGTRNGGLTAIRTDIALGFTLLAALYMFFRFFMVGAVARARSRLNDNENRNRVLGIIRKEPGNTMYDLARQLDMNTGTVRYHLFILALNHRIVTHRDGKYVRYFGNSNTYSETERAMISLLRRDWARKLFAALQESESMSNAGLARTLGVSEPATSSYLRELTKKGLVTRTVCEDGSVLYSIRADYKEAVAGAFSRIPALAES